LFIFPTTTTTTTIIIIIIIIIYPLSFSPFLAFHDRNRLGTVVMTLPL